MTTQITKNKVIRCWKLEILYILAPIVKGVPLIECFNNRQDFFPLTGEGAHPEPVRGLLFCGWDNFKLWLKRSLDQVTSLLDESKPSGTILFFVGPFSFVFLSLKWLHVFFRFLFF